MPHFEVAGSVDRARPYRMPGLVPLSTAASTRFPQLWVHCSTILPHRATFSRRGKTAGRRSR